MKLFEHSRKGTYLAKVSIASFYVGREPVSLSPPVIQGVPDQNTETVAGQATNFLCYLRERILSRTHIRSHYYVAFVTSRE